jgi:hypothetical protein
MQPRIPLRVEANLAFTERPVCYCRPLRIHELTADGKRTA